MEERTKRCVRCEITRPISEFFVDRNAPDGHRVICAVCARKEVHRSYLNKTGKTETRKRHTMDSPVASQPGHRICTLCGEEKPLDDFEIDKRKPEGHTYRCRKCASAAKQGWVKAGGEEYREKIATYREENRDKVLAGKRDEYARHSDKYKKYGKGYYLTHKEEYVEYSRTKRKKQKGNSLAVLPDRLRVKTRRMLTYYRANREGEKLIGCTTPEFRAHIESLWKEGMTWENYGAGKLGEVAWQLDHIVPISAFDLTDPEQIAKCFHYTNVQPLWWEENMSKHNSIN